ncbi:hypothetical protein FQA47_016136 [Oryzias melastigma]|uniref:Uncharacterized protein n=1 Tax=Oryzias melastigma TaxID=30732 RepID=A0A834FSN7_ORYME|nr:hypothetical protein FQA47_016136 [Oryzias melastigma]
MAAGRDCAGRALSAGVVVAGAAFLLECPAAPLLPVYVLVFGVWVLLLMLLFSGLKLLCSAAPAGVTWTLGAIFILLLLLWILFGSYQVYSIYPPDYQRNETDPSGPPQDGVPAENGSSFREGGRFCNRSLYLLAFWTTTIVHVLAGSTLLGTLCLCASMKGVEVFVQHLQP